MGSGFKLFVDIAPAAIIVMIFCLIALVPYRKERAAVSLIIYIVFICWLLIAGMAELISPPGPLTKLFATLRYVALVAIPVAWVSFSLRYTGWIKDTQTWLIAGGAAISLFMFCLVATNDLHHLFWQQPHYFESEGFSALRGEHGPLFWIVFVYCWIAVVLGTVFILRAYFSGPKLYRRQSLWLIAGILFPGITNAVYIFHLIPGFIKDFTPLGYALSGVCFLINMYLHRLFWIMPVSRSALLQNLRIGLLVLDTRGYIIDHNPAIDRIFGLNGVYIGHKAMEFPPLREFFSKIKYTPGSGPPRIPLGRYDIGNLTYAWQLQTQTNDSGSCVFILENISAQLALENDVNRIKAEFIRRERLVSIGQLSAGLAHEINNPLAYLKSDLRSLERLIERKLVTDADKDLKEIVQITKGIADGLDRIGKVVQSLLAFTRKGSMDAEAELYDLHEGIDSTLEIMHYEYREIADIKKDYGTIPPIVIQKNEINQVLFNILTNAIQAIKEHPKEGGYRGLITIRTGFSKMHVWCEIENNGPPISPETAPRVFELFYTTKSDKLGTGLGLNFSQDVVEHRNHGRLTLVSCDPVVFRMELPAVEG